MVLALESPGGLLKRRLLGPPLTVLIHFVSGGTPKFAPLPSSLVMLRPMVQG